MSLRTIVLALITTTLGCSVPDLALIDLECPCIDGWRCDLSRNICVEETSVADAGSTDATLDSVASDVGSADTSPRDVGASDALFTDSGPVEAGPEDAGPEDAGPDAPLSDAGADAGPVDPCDDLEGRVDVYRCDSFERVGLGYAIATTDGTIEITDERAHSGTRAALVTPPSTGDAVSMLIGSYPNNQDGQRWFRGWFFVPPIPMTFGIEPVLLESADGATQVAVYTEGPSYSEVHGHGLAMPEPSTVSTARFELGTWVCVEVHIDYANGRTPIEMYFDSVLAAQIETPSPGALTTARVGLPYINPVEGQPTLFVDDVILSSTQIGCGP